MKKLFYFFIVLIPILAIILYPTNVLVISDGNTSHTFIIGGDGLNVTIYYIHSVERSPVYEMLKVNGSGIYVVEMKWQDFGAGLPEDIQKLQNGYYVKYVDIYIGKNFSYWFIPLNHAHIWVNGVLVYAPHSDTLIHFNVERTVLVSAV